MWYTYRPASFDTSLAPPGTLSGHIALAISEDGLSWDLVKGPHEGAVLAPNNEQWWTFDVAHLTCGDVVCGSNSRVRADGGVYFLYYTGGDAEKVQVFDKKWAGVRTRIGVAISKDGENFSRLEGEFPSGAILDVGAEGDFDELSVAAPSVTPVPEGYIMHYTTIDLRRKQALIGRAVSVDGISFIKEGIALQYRGDGIGDSGFARGRVVERGGRFFMFVEAMDTLGTGRVHRIAMCESDDCKEWSDPRIVLELGEPGSWDEAGVANPYPVQMDDGSLRLYYIGKDSQYDVEAGRGYSIGVAESNGENWNMFTRIGKA